MPPSEDPAAPDAGFVFAATGERYRTLARRAARALRQAMPDAAIDLFTDEALADDVFDRIHRTADGWFRPKMEALARSRFRRTLYLDSDILVIADIGDVFEVLERHDVVGSHGIKSNSRLSRRTHTQPIPAAFPQVNGGVLGIRRSAATEALADDWQRAVRESGGNKDQPALRELLWESDLRLAVLPRQYNLNTIAEIRGWTTEYAAPRVIHAPQLHRAFVDHPPEMPIALSEVTTRAQAAQLARLVAADPTITLAPPIEAALAFRAGRAGMLLRDLMARLA